MGIQAVAHFHNIYLGHHFEQLICLYHLFVVIYDQTGPYHIRNLKWLLFNLIGYSIQIWFYTACNFNTDTGKKVLERSLKSPVVKEGMLVEKVSHGELFWWVLFLGFLAMQVVQAYKGFGVSLLEIPK